MCIYLVRHILRRDQKNPGTFGGYYEECLESLVYITLYMYYERVYFFPNFIYVLYLFVLFYIYFYNKIVKILDKLHKI